MEFEDDQGATDKKSRKLRQKFNSKVQQIRGQLEAEMKIVEGMPGNNRNKKHNIKALAAINAKTLAKEFKNSAKATLKVPKKWKKNRNALDQAFADLSTNDLAVRKMQKSDFDHSKGYYELQVMTDDQAQVHRSMVYIKRSEYQKYFGAQHPDGNVDYYQVAVVCQSECDERVIGVASLTIERVLYGKDHSIKKKEGNISKIMYNKEYENQGELQKILVGALEQVAWHRNCDLVRLPFRVEEQVVIDLDFMIVFRGGRSYYIKSQPSAR